MARFYNMFNSNFVKYPLTDLFKVQGTKTTTLKKLIASGEGGYPYVTTRSTNNGVSGYYNLYTEKGGVLTIDSAVAGFCSYQTQNFSASDHVEKLVPIGFALNMYNATYLTTIINSNQVRFSYGIKANQNTIKKLIIELPSIMDENNVPKPDWEQIENYMKMLFEKESKKCKTNIVAENTELCFYEWKPYKFRELFNYKRGRRYKKSDHLLGEVAYVSSSSVNNGIDGYVLPLKGLQTYSNVMTLANSGSVGKCFYHSYTICPSDHVHCFWIKDCNIILNKYIAMFLIPIIEKNKTRFMFNKEISEKTLDEIEIMLPTKNKNPDWNYMENYIRKLPYSDRI